MGVECISQVVRRGRLMWFVLVEGKAESVWVKRV